MGHRWECLCSVSRSQREQSLGVRCWVLSPKFTRQLPLLCKRECKCVSLHSCRYDNIPDVNNSGEEGFILPQFQWFQSIMEGASHHGSQEAARENVCAHWFSLVSSLILSVFAAYGTVLPTFRAGVYPLVSCLSHSQRCALLISLGASQSKQVSSKMSYDSMHFPSPQPGKP
jgi:hypothetical protein